MAESTISHAINPRYFGRHGKSKPTPPELDKTPKGKQYVSWHVRKPRRPKAHAAVVHLRGAQTSTVGTKPCSYPGTRRRERHREGPPRRPHPAFLPSSARVTTPLGFKEPAEIRNLPHAYPDRAKDDQQIGPAAPVADLKIPGLISRIVAGDTH